MIHIYSYICFWGGIHIKCESCCESCQSEKKIRRLCDMKQGAKYILYKAVMSQNDCGKHAIFETPKGI
jgi:hypothetical protein